MDLSRSWVQLLEHRLNRKGYPHEVVNASISGETTSGGASRLPDLLERYRPEVVILELGGNDGLRGLPVDAMAQNLATMVERSRAAGARVLLVGMQLPPNYGPVYTEAFSGVYRRLAERYGVALVPFLLEGVAGNRATMQPDGMHAAAAAQPQLLENVWPHLKPLLRQPSASSR